MLSYITLAIDHECAYSQFSKAFPDVEIKIWCKNSYDMIVLKKGRDYITEIEEYISNHLGNIVDFFVNDNIIHMILKNCYCDNSMLNYIRNLFHNVDIPPIIYREGKEILRLIITTEEIDLFLEKLKASKTDLHYDVVNINHIKEFDMEYPFYLSLQELLENLTDKQLNSILLAYENGYYEIPRKITLEELAEKEKINRKTFEEHLRKSENKLMRNLLPAISLLKR